MLYQVILFNAGDDFGTREDVEFADDAAAIAHAREHLWPWTYEIWRGNALVVHDEAADAVYQIIARAPPLILLRKAA